MGPEPGSGSLCPQGLRVFEELSFSPHKPGQWQSQVRGSAPRRRRLRQEQSEPSACRVHHRGGRCCRAPLGASALSQPSPILQGGWASCQAFRLWKLMRGSLVSLLDFSDYNF